MPGHLIALLCTLTPATPAPNTQAPEAGNAASARVESVALNPRSPAAEGTRFERLGPERTGLDFENPFAWGHPLERLYPHGFAGGGVAIGDADGDGLPDLFLTSQTGRDRLYRNLGDLRFEDVTEGSGIDNPQWSSGAVFADVDGDRDQDLFVCNYEAPNRLYVNLGNGRFEEQAAARGLDFAGASVMGAFADHDLDGDLDLYLVTNRLWPGAAHDAPRTRHVNGLVEVDPTQAESYVIQERRVDGELQKYVVKAGQRDRLYVNDGTGRFEEAAEAAGITGNHPGLSATWWDVDQDGAPDLYVSNDFWDADRLYHNRGDGTFVDRAAEWAPSTPWFSMGADHGDVDRDGRVDFLAADMSATTHYMSKVMMGGMEDSRWFLESAEPRQMMRNNLLLATGVGPLREAAHLAGLASSDWTWSVAFGDLDLDGWLDLHVTNGTANQSFNPDFTQRLKALAADQSRRGVRDPVARATEQWALYREQGVRPERNLAFRGGPELAFEEVSREYGLDQRSVSFGSALADLDRDGDLDLVVQNVGAPLSLFANRTATGHALLVELVGPGANTAGVGTRLTFEYDGARRAHQLFTTRGYMSSTEPVVHLGLGSAASADVRLEGPGFELLLEDLQAGQLHRVTLPAPGEPQPEPVPGAAGRAPAPTVFVEEDPAALGPAEPEPDFDDYARQPLLPAKLSREGPCLALGDVDGDGDDDLFVGGPAGVAGRLHRFDSGAPGTAVGTGFGPGEAVGVAEAASEDTAALFVDVDLDGDLDLYVGSGGVEAPAGDARYRDRVYLNDGAGGLRAAPNRLEPGDASTGALAAADIDRDGDLDLFAGSRSVPGRYPERPRSRLLLNQQGKLLEAPDGLAPGLGSVGLVTGALFTDVDRDGWPDLLVTCEWGAVELFRNHQGKLRRETEAAGLGARLGWWNGVTAFDVDGDGDQDYLCANVGTNTKYHASPEKPAQLFFGDFDGSGERHLVEAKRAEGELLPVRGLSCSSEAMPWIAEKLPTFDAFASSSLVDIYTPEGLGSALTLEASELRSGVLINGSTPGHPAFEWRPLPWQAQLAPVQGVAAADFDADGHGDLLLAQNFFWREPETGRWNGGLGLLLRGDGAGWLAPAAPEHSGYVVRGDARALVVHAGASVRVLTALNDGGLRVHRPRADLRALRLAGLQSNSIAAGARVLVDGRAVELAAGQGKASQNGPVVLVPRDLERAAVEWPDGTRREYALREDHGPGAEPGPAVLRRGP